MSSQRPGDPRLSQERVTQLKGAVLAQTNRTTPRKLTRPVAVAAVATISVLGLGGTAAAWVVATRPDNDHQAYCATTVTTDRDVWSQNGVAAATGPDGIPSAFDAVDACAAGWRIGALSEPGAQPGADGQFPVPVLTACVVEGQAVVYPAGSEVCSELGVPQLAKK